jgi:hypothetical protein
MAHANRLKAAAPGVRVAVVADHESRADDGAAPEPEIIQGGMGVAVSGWRLARAVSMLGQLGVVSGTALDVVLARRLQLGDPTGDLRRAIRRFPDPAVAERVLASPRPGTALLAGRLLRDARSASAGPPHYRGHEGKRGPSASSRSGFPISCSS